jgi:hypothetical protein
LTQLLLLLLVLLVLPQLSLLLPQLLLLPAAQVVAISDGGRSGSGR